MSDKDKALERIYTHPTNAEYNVNPWPLEPSEYVEYIRADLVATKVREARGEVFKDVIAVVMERGEILHRGNLIAALERTAESGEGESDG